MKLDIRTIGGRDLAVDFECKCLDEKWKGTNIEHIMNRRIHLYGYNDYNFFANVNAQPREYTCKCGRVYTEQWFTDGYVEVNLIKDCDGGDTDVGMDK